jgi:UDP-N-acetylglucosamine acyltransferase
MAYVHIAHDCVIGDNVILVNAVQLAGHVQVEDFAIVGGASVVHQFVRIGSHVIIAGGSLIGKDVPPFSKAARDPLRYCGINSIGLRRRGFTNDQINEIQDIYRVLYIKGHNTTKAVEILEIDFPPSKERDEILNFIRSSDRGIMKGSGV